MTDLPRVGVVHAPFGAANLFDIARAANGHCEPVLLIPEEVAAAHPDLIALGGRMFPVVVAPVTQMVTAASGQDLAGVTTFHDGCLEAADAVIDGLGLPGMAAKDPWDKLAHRQVLATAGLSRVRALPVDSADEFMAAWAELGGPGVLKPRRGVGGSGVAFVDSDRAVGDLLRLRRQWSGLMLETRIPSGAHPSGVDWLADFVSVETFSTDGPHRNAAVFDKSPMWVRRREGTDIVRITGDVLQSRLPEGDRAELVGYVHHCLSALGVRWRVTHTEVALTPAGPQVIEVNGRVGGYLNALLRWVGGPDLVRAALYLARGVAPPTADGGLQGWVAGLVPRFPEPDGAVRSQVTVAQLRGLPGVVTVDEVAEAGRPRADSDFRMARLTVRAESGPELDGLVADCRKSLADLFADDAADADHADG